MSGIWSIDIETIGLPTQAYQGLRKKEANKIAQLVEEDKARDKDDRQLLDKRLKDPEKLDRNAQDIIAKAQELIRPKDSLDPLTAMPICVVCILADDMNEVESFVTLPDFYSWAEKEPHQFLGFNIRDFDLLCLKMFLARTSKGQIPEIPALQRDPIDLYYALGDRWNSFSNPHTLRNYVASILDIEAQQDGVVKEYLESDFTGADVATAYVEGNMELIIRHCTLDALMAALIAKKLRIV